MLFISVNYNDFGLENFLDGNIIFKIHTVNMTSLPSPTYELTSPQLQLVDEPSIPDNVQYIINPQNKQELNLTLQIMAHYINSSISKDKQILSLQKEVQHKEEIISTLKINNVKWGINITPFFFTLLYLYCYIDDLKNQRNKIDILRKERVSNCPFGLCNYYRKCYHCCNHHCRHSLVPTDCDRCLDMPTEVQSRQYRQFWKRKRKSANYNSNKHWNGNHSRSRSRSR